MITLLTSRGYTYLPTRELTAIGTQFHIHLIRIPIPPYLLYRDTNTDSNQIAIGRKTDEINDLKIDIYGFFCLQDTFRYTTCVILGIHSTLFILYKKTNCFCFAIAKLLSLLN